ncbi:MAG TPA: class I SAM-dependent methyltransferase [Spirochaetia bacterium]
MIDARDFYDGLGPEYDRMVAWEGRLAREETFFRGLFADAGARSVLDAACGTGMHAISFARLGLRSAGADLSPVMIEKARQNAAVAGVSVGLHVAGFGGIAPIAPGPFDAVTCLGNSLPHLTTDAELAGCLEDFRRLLAPGGLLVVQNRNYDRLLRERQRFMPVAARGAGEGETLFLRITDYPPPDARPDDAITFTLLTLTRTGGAWRQVTRSTPLRALRRATLEAALRAAGFAELAIFGGYDRGPAEADDAADLVVVARAPKASG